MTLVQIEKEKEGSRELIPPKPPKPNTSRTLGLSRAPEAVFFFFPFPFSPLVSLLSFSFPPFSPQATKRRGLWLRGE